MPLISHWLVTLDDGDTPSPPVVIPIGINQPNPGETVWRLGIGGVPVSPHVRAGWDLILTTSLYNNGTLLSYSPDPLLEAVVWRGDGQPNGFFPQVEWTSAPASDLRAAIPGTATASFEPGIYRFRVGITVQGVRCIAYDGTLEIEASPGNKSVGRDPYVLGSDLALWYDKLKSFQNRDTDQAAFRQQCIEASDQFERRLIDSYMARPGFTRRRNPGFDPVLGYDVPDPTLAPPTKAQLTAWLAAGGLVVEPITREIIARTAIALVLDRQTTEAPNPYTDEAQKQRDRAEAMWRTLQAQVRSVPTNPPDWLIDRDATFLPAGAAP